jgi:hypothetical protein
MAAKLKDKTDIDHHGPKYILIICHLPDPPTFSLPTNFKTVFKLLKQVNAIKLKNLVGISDTEPRDLELLGPPGFGTYHLYGS